MGSIIDRILKVLNESDHPMTTVEITRSVYGNYQSWEHHSHRGTIYAKLTILEKQGFVKKSGMNKVERMWVIA